MCTLFANSLLGATIQDGGMSERSDDYACCSLLLPTSFMQTII